MEEEDSKAVQELIEVSHARLEPWMREFLAEMAEAAAGAVEEGRDEMYLMLADGLREF